MLAGLQNVTFEFGARALIRDTTWHIQPQERIGLIGYNGTGKSTILKLLAGEYLPSSGTVEFSRGSTIGYLHQDLLGFDSRDSILQVALGAFEPVLNLEKEIEELGKELEKEPDESKAHLYAEKLHEFDLKGGYTMQHRTEEVLQGLGFANSDLQRPYQEFSGGWRMRVLLAKMILQQPDLLLLDEPTNHLDLPSIEWLEKYLQHYQGAVVIVSHDKFFLNRMVTKIVELYQQQLHFYSGDYSFYEKEKELRMEIQQRAFANQQDYIRQQERFIERFKAKASKATQAQSVQKRLDKLDRIEDVKLERPSIKINFQVDKTPGRVICTLKDVSKSFGPIRILEHASAEIDRGDKIALIGANGKGKSTLLRIIAGTESYEGTRNWGHQVEESFYAQHQLEALDLSHTILDELKSCGSQKTEQELRNLLGCFLFSGEEVDKRIRVLSGGEKARVALAKTIISKANFLILDEPTNHLDMHSVELLVEALNKYQGSLILVSHDRYFISKSANKIWEINDGLIREFKGGYEEYVEWIQREKTRMENDKNGTTTSQEAESKDVEAKAGTAFPEKQQGKPSNSSNEPHSALRNNKAIDKEKQKEKRKWQKKFEEAEQILKSLKEKKLQIESALSNPTTYSDKEKFIGLEQSYKQLLSDLEKSESDYENIFEKMMELDSE